MAELLDSYAEPNLDALGEGTRLAVINFSATWCGPCRRQDPLFERVADTVLEEHPQAPVAFLVVDVDENGPLASKRRVKSVPTTLIVAKQPGFLWGETWREKARFTGVIPYPRLLEKVREHLDALEA